MAETFLSDVHIYTENKKTDGKEMPNSQEKSLVVSRFEFTIQMVKDSERVKAFSGSEHDEDGDLILIRNCDNPKEVVNIYHTMATPLSLVGQQVWRGALLLADYLVSKGEDILSDQIVLELGAGTGLLSIISALYARYVFATDTGDDVLDICYKNSTTNRHITGPRSNLASVAVRELNWTNSAIFVPTVGKWTWKSEDKELLSECTVLLAADIVYDDSTSDAFLSTINNINNKLPSVSVLYLALEKRLNFTLDDLDVACPAYTYFFEQLARCRFIARYHMVSTTFHQAFQYERVPQLELWEISLKKKDSLKSVLPMPSSDT